MKGFERKKSIIFSLRIELRTMSYAFGKLLWRLWQW